MLHLENFFEKSFALLLTTPKSFFTQISSFTEVFLCGTIKKIASQNEI